MSDINIKVPDDPADKYEDDVDPKTKTIIKSTREKMTYLEKKQFDKEIAIYVSRKEHLHRDMEKAYSIIYVQCSRQLQDKLKTCKE